MITKSFICILALVLMGASLLLYIFYPNFSDNELSSLRSQYPINDIYPDSFPAEIKQQSLQQIAQRVSSYAVVEIISKEEDVSYPGIWPSKKVKELWESQGISPDPIEYYNYRISVIDTIILRNNLGDKPIIAGSQLYNNLELIVSLNKDLPEPKLDPGMIVVMPISAPVASFEHPVYMINLNGLYYVTEDNYVISGYEELEGTDFSGQPLAYLKSELEQLGK